MGAVCSKGVRVSALGQCVLRAQSFIVGTGAFLVEVECSGFQCVLDSWDIRLFLKNEDVLGCQNVLPGSVWPQDQSTVGVGVSWLLGDSGCIQVSLSNPNVRMSWESQSPAES